MSDKKQGVDLSGILGGGGLLSGLGKLVEVAAQLNENGEKIESRLQDLQDKIESGQAFESAYTTSTFKAPGSGEGVFGFRIRTVAGEPQVETFGNIKQDETGATVYPVREPLTDVLEDDTGITVIAELPGAQAESISLSVSGRHLTLEASGAAGRRFEKTVDLPTDVLEESMQHRFNNGILDVRLPKA